MGRDAEQPEVARVVAAVHEERAYHDALARVDRARPPGDERFEVRTVPGSNRVGLRVVLSAVLDDGRRVSEDSCLGIGGAATMSLEEVREQLERMLGRDPALRRPPRLAWDGLLAALQRSGVGISERELIAARLELRVEPSARSALATT